jgi:hypothetical protein
MLSQDLFFALVLLLPFTIGYLFPRVSAYFLGPALLVIAAAAFLGVHSLFVPFQSDGSAAGLLVPAMMWAALVTACISGVVLILTGGMKLRWEDAPPPRAPTDDRASLSNSRAAFFMFNVALGIAMVIGPFLPTYLVFSGVYGAVMKITGIFGSRVFLLLCTYFLPAFALYFAFRFAGMQRRFALSTRGNLLIVLGNLVVLLFEIAYVARFLPGANAVMYSGLLFLTQFRQIEWLPRAAILIGLFLFWKEPATLNDGMPRPA